jgi:DNA mismatch endonuclease, patch repair protein
MKLGAGPRRELMARFKSTNTRSELALRRSLWLAGIKGYRLHVRKLPGRPDIVFGRWRVAVFVDGEFWHGHPSAFRFGTKGEYWDAKIARNQARDLASNRALHEAGWTVVRLWARDVERNPAKSAAAVARELGAAGRCE